MRREEAWGAAGKGLLVSKRGAERLDPDFLVAWSFLDVTLRPPRGHEKKNDSLWDQPVPQNSSQESRNVFYLLCGDGGEVVTHSEVKEEATENSGKL